MTIPTGNPHLDSISWGNWHWVNYSGGPLILKYYFDNDFSTWSSAEKTAYRAAFQAWADVADFTIQETSVESEANFIAHSLSNAQMNSKFTVPSGSVLFGVHETPEDGTGGVIHGYYNYQTYSWPSDGIVYDTAGLVSGGWGFRTMMHELGHGLGLAHPHDNGGGSPLMPGVSNGDDYGDNNLNQGVFTIMSYNRGWEAVQNPQGNHISDYGYNYGPGAFDIAIIQYKYGANTNFHSGDDTYVIMENGAWRSIWDTGGTDEIVYNGSHDVVIDLRSATLDNTPHGGGYLSYVQNSGGNNYYGGFTIAADYTNVIADQGGETGVIIENAIGGSGNDVIVGNNVGNILVGNYGNDTISGNGGWDYIYGGAGSDTLSGGWGGDRIWGGSGDDKIWGGVGNLRDILWGEDGRDMIWGGGGDDLIGGGDLKDRIWGGDGNDTIWGGSGWDVLYGEDGDDTIGGGYGNDWVFGGYGRDIIWGSYGNDKISGGERGDQLYGGDGNDHIWGNSGWDYLYGGNGNDYLNGGYGNDLLSGGGGYDTFVYMNGYGYDVIVDFEDNVDAIDLSAWGFSSSQDLLSYARQEGIDVIFDFTSIVGVGGNVILEVQGIQIYQLIDDIIV